MVSDFGINIYDIMFDCNLGRIMKDPPEHMLCPGCGVLTERHWHREHDFCYHCYSGQSKERCELRAHLMARQGGKCIISGCNYDEKKKGNCLMHTHRIVRGVDGGEYTLDNCVLVCKNHHRKIEKRPISDFLDTDS